MQDASNNVQLRVQNTFLHVVDVNIESQKLSRSHSESSLDDSRSRRSSEIPTDGPSSLSRPMVAVGPEHYVASGNLAQEPPVPPRMVAATPEGLGQNILISTGSESSSIINSSQTVPIISAGSQSAGSQSGQVPWLAPDIAEVDYWDRDGPSSEYSESADQETVVEAAAWSEGSKLHKSGECRPCAWNWKPSGCVKENRCEFCHQCGQDVLKSGLKARKQAQRRTRTANRRAARASKDGGVEEPEDAGQATGSASDDIPRQMKMSL